MTLRICFILEMSDPIKINPRIWTWYETAEDSARELSRIAPPAGQFEEVKENVFTYVHKSEIGNLQMEPSTGRVAIIPINLIRENVINSESSSDDNEETTYGFVKLTEEEKDGKKIKRIRL